jgi:GNAT superfamily N-acetyltransferase
MEDVLVPLHDGSAVLIRPIAPSDAPLLRRAHRLMSSETIRNRYFMPKPTLSSSDLRFLTDVDGVDHAAVVAVDPRRPEAILGVARWIRDPAQPDQAEAAFVVVDRAQGTGVGSALAIALTDLAIPRGVTTLTGSMLSDNRQSEGMFRRMGGEIAVRREGITNEVVTKLPRAENRLRRLAHNRRMRPGRRSDRASRRPAHGVTAPVAA